MLSALTVITSVWSALPGGVLEREHGADGDHVEGEREVGHAESGEKLSEGAARVHAEERGREP